MTNEQATVALAPKAAPESQVASSAISSLFAVPSSKLTQLAGQVIPMPMYPGLDMDRRIGMEQLKDKITKANPSATSDQINNAFNQYFGGGAKVLPLPGVAP